MRILMIARTAWNLGIGNVLRVILYRALRASGAFTWLAPIQHSSATGSFFEWATSARRAPAGVSEAEWRQDAARVLQGELEIFSNRWVQTGFPPRWHRSVLSGQDLNVQSQHWSRIPDFGLSGGDVKGYWEVARFHGLLVLALGWLCSGEERFRDGLEAWLGDWQAHNPVNAGVHWKCGQETSIRLMHVLLVTVLLDRWGGVRPTQRLVGLVADHCRRIAMTLSYAIAQDNNHGTSEAAALFGAGAWLARFAPTPADQRLGHEWTRKGRACLEERVRHLVMKDGSFAQHSVNYHRLLLDTCSFAETMRRALSLEPFTSEFGRRCEAAARWAGDLIDPGSGDAPNLGANDGARLFVLHRRPYRDFRPAVQWGSVLFRQVRAYAGDAHDEPLKWWGIDAASLPVDDARRQSGGLWTEGGYAKLQAGDAWALLRLPRYRFRPSHADALHLDVWSHGTNVVRDGGSFSYNTDPQWLRYFTGTASHSTIEFDGRDQMPRISRFLFGAWLDNPSVAWDGQRQSVTAHYRDWQGAEHVRSVSREDQVWTVIDRISGFRERAVLRWRLAPAAWGLEGLACRSQLGYVRVESSVPARRVELAEGWESRHYGEKSPVPVFEVEIGGPLGQAAIVKTTLAFA